MINWNSGYIHLNAAPSGSSLSGDYTPYMDIIQRTGSGYNDISVKARLGRLDGISSGLLFGDTDPGFGLYSENVYLQGGITARTGSFTGIMHAGDFSIGKNVN